MNLCSETIGGARIRLMSRPRENGFYRNHYLVVTDASYPQVTAIKFVGECRAVALQRFEVSRDNAVARLAFEAFDAV